VKNLELNSEHRELADSVRRLSEWIYRDDTEVITRAYDPTGWRRLAELGVLALATEEGGGGAVHVAAVMEQLGRAGFCGPLVETFTAGQLLPPELRDPVLAGESIATLAAESPWVPWAPLAKVFIKLEEDGFAYLAAPASPIVQGQTLGGQPWGELELDASDRLGPAGNALALADVARAAYLAGASARVIELASDYARYRKQFGRSLGEFQAVAHPLAECYARTKAARQATLFAAHQFDADTEQSAPLAAAARLSATDAVTRASYTGHQVLGGMGFVEGTLLSVLTRLARTESLAPPGLEATRLTALRRFEVPANA
jgi:alkylation response protein AidB-like acyl-CoA dehydrogenase